MKLIFMKISGMFSVATYTIGSVLIGPVERDITARPVCLVAVLLVRRVGMFTWPASSLQRCTLTSVKAQPAEVKTGTVICSLTQHCRTDRASVLHPGVSAAASRD